MNHLQVFLEGTSRQASLRAAYLFNECSDKTLAALLTLPALREQFNRVKKLYETDAFFAPEVVALCESAPAWLKSSVKALQEDEDLYTQWATGQYKVPDAATYDPFTSAGTAAPIPATVPQVPQLPHPVASTTPAPLGNYSPSDIPFTQTQAPIHYGPGGSTPDTTAVTGAATSTASAAKSGLAAFAAANPILAIGGAAAAAVLAAAGGYSLYQAYQKAQIKQAAKLEGAQAKEALRQTCIGVLSGLRAVPSTDRAKAISQGLSNSGAVSYMKDGKLRTLKNFATIVQAVNDIDKVDVFYYKPETSPKEAEKTADKERSQSTSVAKEEPSSSIQDNIEKSADTDWDMNTVSESIRR